MRMSSQELEIARTALQAALLACKMLQDAIDLNDAPEVGECLDALSTDAQKAVDNYYNATTFDEEKSR